jgi:hypothetical protein
MGLSGAHQVELRLFSQPPTPDRTEVKTPRSTLACCCHNRSSEPLLAHPIPPIPQATVPAAPERSSPGPDQGSRLTPTHGSPWTRAPYSPLRDGRRAQLLGPKEWSGRDSRRVPGQAGQGESGLAGQEPGSRPAPPPGRLAPPCCGLSQVDPTVAGRRGILIQLSPRWTQGQTEG